ncbi:MAG: SDR family oxidoreductase [Sphingomonas phyllosphaerae]
MRVLVTGGAKRLGAAIARAVAAAGHVPVIHYGSSQAEAEALAAELGGAAVQGDLSDLADVPELFVRACEGGPVDGLVNSASLFEYDAPSAPDATLAARLQAVNVGAPSLLAAALAGQGRDGAVVNLLDQKLANPNPDFYSYTLTKAALAQATVLMAQAFAPRVRVNAVSPGLTLPSGDQTDAEFDAVARANLLQHPVGADAVADAVVWLLEARSVTGQNVFVDCGQRFVKSARDVMFGTDHG